MEMRSCGVERTREILPQNVYVNSTESSTSLRFARDEMHAGTKKPGGK